VEATTSSIPETRSITNSGEYDSLTAHDYP
jgi:hypothetical protein